LWYNSSRKSSLAGWHCAAYDAIHDRGAKLVSKKITELSGLSTKGDLQVDENQLFERVSEIIETRKSLAGAYANREVTMMYWEVGHYINSVVLDGGRAAYGKKILTTLSAKLVAKYGKSFSERNLYRMMLFASRFVDSEILPTLSAKLSWSHFLELLPLKSAEAQMYYAAECCSKSISVQDLRRLIKRKGFERRGIANAEVAPGSAVPLNVFKDPYLLDVFGLKDNYLEADLESAILADIESFLLEFGNGFAFMERQKRMILDGEDIVLDLLFYHRIMRRLVAVELKLGRFKAAYFGQMALYLKWLDRYERQPGEESPIGLILCASANREKVEMLELGNAGIAVAEYWTEMPPKAEFERRIREILTQARERLERQKTLLDDNTGTTRQINYYLEPKDEDDE
jgi:predicted nuclease of restriction endonuclease-like (RecB) superfamily